MHRQRKNTNLGVGESLKLKSRLLFHKALYSIGSFNAFASALVPKTLVLNLQPSSYVIPYVPQNIFPFWEANNKTHGTEINQKKKSNTKLWKKKIGKQLSPGAHTTENQDKF